MILATLIQTGAFMSFSHQTFTPPDYHKEQSSDYFPAHLPLVP
ncbi:hypothetical protein EV685_0720 [Sphaerotilus mobilis]|uniref:Uncharacterized protein n=1 Tax=Sphaerotilus mobilis TaxID=47994 RepID=A0A4Q7LVP0_9BURK|nr:hypothetical protein EV685_0720 [Sphaerotilus mobilis]